MTKPLFILFNAVANFFSKKFFSVYLEIKKQTDAPKEEAKAIKNNASKNEKIAPIKIAVLPLSRNEKLSEYSRNIFDRLNSLYTTQYDDTQSIGRRYRRQDEVGTPLCVTIDFESVEEDDSVTIRNRDTMEQIRVSSDKLLEAINDQLKSF